MPEKKHFQQKKEITRNGGGRRAWEFSSQYPSLLYEWIQLFNPGGKILDIKFCSREIQSEIENTP